MIPEIIEQMWVILEQIAPNGANPVIFWLSFILVFALTYLLLSLTHIFKEHNGLNALVSLVIAYFAAGSAFASIFLAEFFPNLTIALWAILGLLMVMIVGGFKGKSSSLLAFAGFIAVLFVIFGTWQAVSARMGVSNSVYGLTSEDWAALGLLGFIGLIIYFAFKGNPPKGKTKWDLLGEMLGGEK